MGVDGYDNGYERDDDISHVDFTAVRDATVAMRNVSRKTSGFEAG